MIARFALSFFLAALSVAPAGAAERSAPKTVETQLYDLNIANRRIEEGPYFASLEVGLERPLVLAIGVELAAQKISMLLQGVRGTVQFHGDLSRLTRIINARNAARTH